jgi:hypothetical protein
MSNIIIETISDTDKFSIKYLDPSLTTDEKIMILVLSIFIDLEYFERKANLT